MADISHSLLYRRLSDGADIKHREETRKEATNTIRGKLRLRAGEKIKRSCNKHRVKKVLNDLQRVPAVCSDTLI